MPTFMQHQINHQVLRAELITLEQRKKKQDGMLEVIEYRINQIKRALK